MSQTTTGSPFRWLCSFAQQPVNSRVQWCPISLNLFELENRSVSWCSSVLTFFVPLIVREPMVQSHPMVTVNIPLTQDVVTQRKATFCGPQEQQLPPRYRDPIQQSEHNLYLSLAVFFSTEFYIVLYNTKVQFCSQQQFNCLIVSFTASFTSLIFQQ